jgi:hypothetical protein
MVSVIPRGYGGECWVATSHELRRALLVRPALSRFRLAGLNQRNNIRPTMTAAPITSAGALLTSGASGHRGSKFDQTEKHFLPDIVS